MECIRRIHPQVLRAIAFALVHEDGQVPSDFDAVDGVLVGLSRASKTPTALHMAWKYRKRIWCVPFVADSPLLGEVGNLRRKAVVLTIVPERLRERRLLRQQELGKHAHTAEYVDLEAIRRQDNELRDFAACHRLRTVDVTGSGIEENAARIGRIFAWRPCVD